MPPFDNSRDRILIFQYGKVASSSMETSLGHLMDPPRKIPFEHDPKDHYQKGGKIHSKEVATDFLSKVPDGSRVWVITMTRDRYARDISAFFQNLQEKNMTVEELQDKFHSHHSFTDHWFSKDFREVTGVNMMEHANELADGSHNHIAVKHQWQRNGKKVDLNILLLRFEDIKKWQQILVKYFPGFRMTKENTASLKWYATLYKRFIQTLKLNDKEREDICKGESLNFYSDEEKHILAPECYPSRPSQSLEHLDLQSDESGELHVSTSNGELLVADLSDGGFDID